MQLCVAMCVLGWAKVSGTMWMCGWLCHWMEGHWWAGIGTTCLPQPLLCSRCGTVVHSTPVSRRQQDAGSENHLSTHIWPQNRLLPWIVPRLGIRGSKPLSPGSCPGQKERPCFPSLSEQNERGDWRQLGPAQSGTCAWHVTEASQQVMSPPGYSPHYFPSPSRSQIPPTPQPTHR